MTAALEAPVTSTETLDELALDAACDLDPTAPLWAPYVDRLAARGPREVNAAIATLTAARRKHLRRGDRDAAANNTDTLALYRAALAQIDQ